MNIMELFGKQQTIADEITYAFKQQNSLLNKTAFISGEMGVGKTYIGAQIIANMMTPKSLTSVISPAENVKKWDKVLTNATQIQPIIYKRNCTIPESGILIIATKNMTPILKENSEFSPDFILFDEFHTLRPNTVPQANLYHLLTSANKPYLLGMTGTIFGQNLNHLYELLLMRHRELFEVIQLSTYRLSYPSFMAYWNLVSWSISLNDVEQHFKQNETDIEQEIAPIKLIQPTVEQKLVYEIAQEQLSKLHVSTNILNNTTSNVLDLPEMQQVRKVNSSRNLSSINTQSVYPITFAMQKIDLTATQKFQRTVELLKESNENTLIFANYEPLIKRLKEELTKLNYNVDTLKKSAKPAEYSDIINTSFENGTQVFIVNPSQISTGVDINQASRIIWYQLLSDLAKTLQAQRRVYRLSSTKSSIIHYLAYADTKQEKLINEISESAKYNAAAYGVNDTSNLAKLSGALFNFQN